MKWHFWLHPLRGMAAVFVVLLHSYWTWSFYDHSIVRKFYLMVDFFFVLSGFVISSGYFSRIVDFASVKSFSIAARGSSSFRWSVMRVGEGIVAGASARARSDSPDNTSAARMNDRIVTGTADSRNETSP